MTAGGFNPRSMHDRPSTRVAIRLMPALFTLFGATGLLAADPKPATQPTTKIEVEKAPDRVTIPGGLGTRSYEPTALEKTFLDKTPSASRPSARSSRIPPTTWPPQGPLGFLARHRPLRPETGRRLRTPGRAQIFRRPDRPAYPRLVLQRRRRLQSSVHGLDREIHPLELIRVYGKAAEDEPRRRPKQKTNPSPGRRPAQKTQPSRRRRSTRNTSGCSRGRHSRSSPATAATGRTRHGASCARCRRMRSTIRRPMKSITGSAWASRGRRMRRRSKGLCTNNSAFVGSALRTTNCNHRGKRSAVSLRIYSYHGRLGRVSEQKTRARRARRP